ncbi:hypothetical protein QU38_00260, partial [Staphylococcus aureus]
MSWCPFQLPLFSRGERAGERGASPPSPAALLPASCRLPPSLLREGELLSAALPRFAGDDQLLDLAGAFVDPEQPHVAVEPLGAVIGD